MRQDQFPRLFRENARGGGELTSDSGRSAWLTPTRLNVFTTGALSLAFLLGARFLLSDPRTGRPIHLTLPGGATFGMLACPFRSLTGLPCPFCGITTSTILMLHGDLAGSFRAHPLGPFLVIGAFFAVLHLPIALLKVDHPHAKTIDRRWSSWLILGLLALSWAINLARFFIQGAP